MADVKVQEAFKCNETEPFLRWLGDPVVRGSVLKFLAVQKQSIARDSERLEFFIKIRSIACAFIDPRTARYCVPRIAHLDDHFISLVKEGDAERNEFRWHSAEHAYYKSLELYPLHSGYRVQYAHVLKEAGKFVDALVHYMTAFAQGETSAEMIGFIEFCNSQSGHSWLPLARTTVLEYWTDSSSAFAPMEVPPTEQAVVALVQLFLHRTPGFSEIVSLMSSCGTIKDLCLHLVGLNDFATVNNNLLALIANKGRSALS